MAVTSRKGLAPEELGQGPDDPRVCRSREPGPLFADDAAVHGGRGVGQVVLAELLGGRGSTGKRFTSASTSPMRASMRSAGASAR